uniref:Genome polyprotein n=1 Tax=Wenling thamnaconus septentrionalis picornavirus TaxID=2116432 RepID=A0A2P1GN70_9VIRU|nr:polyprotein [Wenling thamnaconus septentrionalis picornavirus]
MELIKPALTKVLGSGLLASPQVEEAEQQSDRLGTTMSVNASTVDQAIVRTNTAFNPPETYTDHYNSMAFGHTSHMLNPQKMVPLANLSWSGTERFKTIGSVDLPKAFYQKKTQPAYGQTRYFRYLRTGFTFKVMVNASAGVAGGLLMVYVPTSVDINTIEHTSYFLLPHVVINLATASSGTLIVPYVSSTNYVLTDSSELGQLRVLILDGAYAPKGSASNVDITIFGTLDGLDLQSVRPQMFPTQQGDVPVPTVSRTRLDVAEGPGVMLLANANHTSRAQDMSLAGDSISHDPTTAGASKEIKDLLELAKVPMPMGNDGGFSTWKNTDPVGTAILQKTLNFEDVNVLFGMLANSFQYWRGSLRISVTVFGTPFTKGRLRLSWFPNETTNITSSQADNGLYTILDLGLQSTITLVVPFAWRNRLRDTVASRVMPLGVFSVHVINRLAVNVNTPNNVTLMTTVAAGDDFMLLAPLSRGTMYQGEGSDEDLLIATTVDGAAGASQAGAASLENVGGDPGGEDTTALGTSRPGNPLPGKPTVANVIVRDVHISTQSHTQLSNLFGRAQYVGYYTVSAAGTGSFKVEIPTSGYMALLKLFGYFSGTFHIHANNGTNGPLTLAHTYDFVPTLSPSMISTRGAVCIPAKANYSMTVPFYSERPLRPLQVGVVGQPSLGSIIYNSGGSGKVHIWISFSPDSHFYFPIGVPLRASLSRRRRHVSGWVDPHEEAVREVAAARVEAALNHKECPKRSNSDQPSDSDEDQIGHTDSCGDHCCNLDLAHRYMHEPLSPCAVPQVSTTDKHEHLRAKLNIHDEGAYTDETPPEPKPAYPMRAPRGVWYKGVLYKSDGTSEESACEPLAQGDLSGMLDMCQGDTKEVMCALAVMIEPLRGLRVMRQWIRSLLDDGDIESNPGPILCHCSYDSHVVDGQDVYYLAVGDRLTTLEHRHEDETDAVKHTGFAIGASVPVPWEGNWITNTCIPLSDAVQRWYVNILSLFRRDGQRRQFFGIGDLIAKLTSYIRNVAVDYATCVVSRALASVATRTLLYAILVYQSPSMTTTLSIGALVAMDMYQLGVDGSGVKALATSMFEGDYAGAISAIGTMMGIHTLDVSTVLHAQSFGSITKNCKDISWWLSKFYSMLLAIRDYFIPDSRLEAVAWMNANTDTISSILHSVDTAIHEGNAHTVFALREPLKDLSLVAMAAGARDVLSTAEKLYNLGEGVMARKESYDNYRRVEPVVAALASEPRQGKSFLTQYIVEEIQRTDPLAEGVFTHPIGSRFFDGYCGQTIHVYDDFGQGRDENEVQNFCQVVSTNAFSPPMAALHDKGMKYNSRYVILTTNRLDANSYVSVTNAEALRSRFHKTAEIRATTLVKDEKGHFSRAKAEAVGDVNKWWERHDGRAWRTFNVTDFVGDIVRTANMKKELHDTPLPLGVSSAPIPQRLGKQGMPTVKDAISRLESRGPPLKSGTSKFKEHLSAAGATLKSWVQDSMRVMNRLWDAICKHKLIFASIAGLISVAGAVMYYLRSGQGEEDKTDERLPSDSQAAYAAYATKPMPKPVVKMVPQGDPNELAIVGKYIAFVHSTGVKPMQVYCYDDDKFLMFEHGYNSLMVDGLTLSYRDLSSPVKILSTQSFRNAVGPMDMVLVQVECCFKLPSGCSRMREFVPLKPTVVVTRSADALELTHAVSPVSVKTYPVDSESGDVSSQVHGIVYQCHNYVGMCGSVVCQKQDGGWYAIGIHVAGDSKRYGTAASFVPIVRMGRQGVAAMTAPTGGAHLHIPPKSAIIKSPLHGVWDVEMGPTPMSSSDPRVVNKVDSIVKHGMNKYTGNTFNVEPVAWAEAKERVRSVLIKTIGKSSCAVVSSAIALNGDEVVAPLAFSKSSGSKFKPYGPTKGDIVPIVDGERTMIPTLQAAVTRMMHDIAIKKRCTTYFDTFIKDDLLKHSKIQDANVRLIECSQTDYVIVYRMLMHEFYRKVYSLPKDEMPVAVGINPAAEYDVLKKHLSRGAHLFAMDFTKFDGSLPPNLMAEAVELMAECHTDPEAVRVLHQPVISSSHHLLGEIWTADGGMPSGAPCTSVLNSLCNWLACEYVNVATNGVSSRPLRLVVYGDDVLGSTNGDLNLSLFADSFGMSATSALDKTSLSPWVDWGNATFLKRSFREFPTTNYIVGVLDLQSIKQRIMWQRGPDNFSDQLDSALEEVAMHGEGAYKDFVDAVQPRLNAYGLYAPTHGVLIRRIAERIFELGE